MNYRNINQIAALFFFFSFIFVSASAQQSYFRTSGKTSYEVTADKARTELDSKMKKEGVKRHFSVYSSYETAPTTAPSKGVLVKVTHANGTSKYYWISSSADLPFGAEVVTYYRVGNSTPGVGSRKIRVVE